MDSCAVHSDDVLGDAPRDLIAALDPLGADESMSRLADMNARGDVCALLRVTRKLLPPLHRAERLEVYEAAAATRDLGMLLASLRRHGVEPVEVIPRVEPVMMAWGRLTDMVPRETVLHYSGWNPTGARRRRFTHDTSEDGLIDAVRTSLPPLRRAVRVLSAARELPLDSTGFIGACDRVARELLTLGESMKIARSRVQSAFFATTLRHYFEPIRLGGRSYSGAAAAQLSVGVIDHLLWGSDCKDPMYRDFQEHTMPYRLPSERNLYYSTLDEPSLVTRFVDSGGDTRNHTTAAAGRALLGIFNTLRVFRGRHLTIAAAAYREEVRHCPLGSAGYGPDTLATLLEMTVEARSRLGSVGTVAGSYRVPVVYTPRGEE